MAVVFEKPKSMADVTLHYCPGCTHGIIHRLVCEVIDEMGIEGDTIGVCPRSEERRVGKECRL